MRKEQVMHFLRGLLFLGCLWASLSAVGSELRLDGVTRIMASMPTTESVKKVPTEHGDTTVHITLYPNRALVRGSNRTWNLTRWFWAYHNLPLSETPYKIVIIEKESDGETRGRIEGLTGKEAQRAACFASDKEIKCTLEDPSGEIRVTLFGDAWAPSESKTATTEEGATMDGEAFAGSATKEEKTRSERETSGASASKDSPQNTSQLGSVEDPNEEARVPTVIISNLQQLEELKRKGLIPAGSVSQIKAKLESQALLSFEETVVLLDALDRMFERGGNDKSPADGESWLVWARFVEANKDKISGKSRMGDTGLTVDEVESLLRKHKEFVGVKDVPFRSTKDALYDPELRKSWNSLSEEEKKLWQEYLKSYGDKSDVTDRASKDLRITTAVRFAMALHMSTKYMPQARREAVEALFKDPIFIGSTIASVTVYLALWLAPEPVFTKAAGALTTIALVLQYAFPVIEIINLARTWMHLYSAAEKARKFSELEVAAQNFANETGAQQVRILVALATMSIGKALPTPKPLQPGGVNNRLMAATTEGSAKLGVESSAIKSIVVRKDGSILLERGLPGRSTAGKTRPPVLREQPMKPRAANDNVEMAANDNAELIAGMPRVELAPRGASGVSGRSEGNLALKTESSPKVAEVTPLPKPEPVPQSSALLPRQEPKLAEVIPLLQPEPVLHPPVSAPAQAPTLAPSLEVVPQSVTAPAAQPGVPVAPDLSSLPITMSGAVASGESTASADDAPSQPVMPLGLSRAKKELWKACNGLHVQYKATQGEFAALMSQLNPLTDALSQNRASAEERIEFCAMVNKAVDIAERLETERRQYIKMDCDQFDWFKRGTTPAKRRQKHQNEWSNL